MSATLVDKLTVPFILPPLIAKTLFAAVSGPFRGDDGAPTYMEHVRNAFFRTTFDSAKPTQSQWLVPSITDTYKAWCSKNKVRPDVVDIPNTKARGCWMGNKDSAKCTMLYFHGGGYVTPGTPNHIDFLARMVQWSNGSLAIFVVNYSLSPGVRYPVAIGESVESLRYILSLPGHSPGTTTLGGDSAGGSLVLAILSHISDHPHPQSDIVKPLAIEGFLKGAIVIAPATSFDNVKYPSFNKFANRDLFTPSAGTYWLKTYMGGAPDDEYVYAALAAPEWWANMKTPSLLVTAGEQEILFDAILDFAGKYKAGAGGKKISLVVGTKETHISPMFPLGEDRLDQLGPEKCQEAAVRAWVRSL